MEKDNGLVYVLTNPAMPGIVKIGLTTRLKIEDRLKELFTTNVPVPFKCEFACQVDDCSKVESALHKAFRPFPPLLVLVSEASVTNNLPYPTTLIKSIPPPLRHHSPHTTTRIGNIIYISRDEMNVYMRDCLSGGRADIKFHSLQKWEI